MVLQNTLQRMMKGLWKTRPKKRIVKIAQNEFFRLFFRIFQISNTNIFLIFDFLQRNDFFEPQYCVFCSQI
jgi:ABC-type antimicrobial peptide transport system ATPase subunit